MKIVKTNALNAYKSNAGFHYRASVEEIHIDASRGVDKELIATLARGNYLQDGESVLISGASSSGKSFIASALGHQTCQQGFKVLHGCWGVDNLVYGMKVI